MGVVPPEPGFLEALRSLCDASGALLVFDEVITGFRVARGGAQERFGVTPRPDDPRQDRRRRAAAGRVRRPRRRDGAARAGGRRLPGGDALREPARDRGRALRAPAPARPGGVRAAGADGRRAGGRARAVRARPARRRDADAVHAGRAGARRSTTRRRATRRALRRALPASARARGLRRAVAVRGDVRLDRARRGRGRSDGARRLATSSVDLWDAIAGEASGREPALGARRYAPAGDRELEPVFSPLARGAVGARAGDDLRGLPAPLRPAAPLRAARPRHRASPRRLPVRARARPHRRARTRSRRSPTWPR